MNLLSHPSGERWNYTPDVQTFVRTSPWCKKRLFRFLQENIHPLTSDETHQKEVELYRLVKTILKQITSYGFRYHYY